MERALLFLGAWLFAGIILPLPALSAEMAANAVPGQVLVCRLQERPEADAGLAGFGQRAGFYFSGVDRAWVALLAVPLGQKSGDRTLTLTAGGVEQGLPMKVLPHPYASYRLKVPGLQRRLRQAGASGDQEALAEVRYEALAGPPDWKGAFRWPLEGDVHVTSGFGVLRSYNQGQAKWRHRGVDLRAPVGTPVLAANDGVVLLAKDDMAVSGATVVLGHGYGLTTAYYHLSAIQVRTGQALRKGQALGLSGASGLASGPHLHWQMELRGIPVDPSQWLPKAAVEETPEVRAADHG